MPCIIRGPGVKPGVVSRAVADLTDILPTLADFSGADLPKDRPFDGHSLGPVLRGETEKHRDWIYSHLDDGRVLRDARWLLEIAKAGKGEKFFDCGESRDGSGYKDVTKSDDPEVKAARARFAEILAGIPEPKPREGVTPLPDGKKANKRHPKKSADAAEPEGDRAARFGKRDKDQDGRISREEFMSTLANPDLAAGEARFRNLDASSDGFLTKEEFLGKGGRAK